MLLKSFHVRVFRNVIDSGQILVGNSTCLVGKNEAGKSSLIEALHRLNPAKPVALNLLDDYPRWLKKDHEITGVIDEAVPITATFALTKEELEAVEYQFATGVLDKPTFEARRRYAGNMELTFPINEAKFIASFKAAHIPVALGARPVLSSATTSGDLAKSLAQISQELSEGSEPTPDAQAAKLAKAALEKALGANHDLDDAIDAAIRPGIPQTFYFGNYSQLRGRYELDEVIPAITAPSDDEELQAGADFLKLARIDTDNLATWDFEQSNSELEAISSLLTQRVKANWRQNQHLKLVVRIESVLAKGSPANVKRYLQFRVDDTRHDFSSRLDRRSTGFRWFVSFIASFFEFEANKNIVLLLDEPGLSLHARAQKDLLDAIDTNLTKGRQVIYTTHSPFMVRTEALERVRIVEDKGPVLGSVTTNDAGKTSDPDTLFPLQAALGYDIAQSLFIGNRNVLLEGTADFIFLNVFSSLFSGSGRAVIPGNSRLLPVGGATNLPTFLALLGDKLDVVVVLDGDAQRQKIDAAIVEGRLSSSRVLNIAQFCSIRGADIEDLFTPDEYLALYNAANKKSVAAADLKGQDRIIKRIERLHGVFDHGHVAAYFLANQATITPGLSAPTLDRFEHLIKAIVAALPPVP
jgi:ABC-type cobalamin/Fe3+-siderophores transport system ATPase subunit